MFLRFKKKTRISELVEGLDTVIEGRVVARKELKLPASGTRCVFYEMSTESYKVGSRGRGRPMWLPERFEVKCTGFFVDDPSGRVWVKGEVEKMSVSGPRKEAGQMGQRRRYIARIIQQGDIVRIRGGVSKPEADERADVLMIGPDSKGSLEILVR